MTYRAIAVGTDGSATATAAVRRAAALAATLDVPLHVINAYRPAPVLAWAGAPEAPIAAEALGDCLAAIAADSEGLIGRTVNDLRVTGVKAAGHAVPGDPAMAILAVAVAQGVDLIVVGNKGMHGARRILGSVPNAVSHTASCDVLIAPPPDPAGSLGPARCRQVRHTGVTGPRYSRRHPDRRAPGTEPGNLMPAAGGAKGVSPCHLPRARGPWSAMTDRWDWRSPTPEAGSSR